MERSTSSTLGSSTHDRPVAVVTGASQGLGLELALGLARDGWPIASPARSSASRP